MTIKIFCDICDREGTSVFYVSRKMMDLCSKCKGDIDIIDEKYRAMVVNLNEQWDSEVEALKRPQPTKVPWWRGLIWA